MSDTVVMDGEFSLENTFDGDSLVTVFTHKYTFETGEFTATSSDVEGRYKKVYFEEDHSTAPIYFVFADSTDADIDNNICVGSYSNFYGALGIILPSQYIATAGDGAVTTAIYRDSDNAYRQLSNSVLTYTYTGYTGTFAMIDVAGAPRPVSFTEGHVYKWLAVWKAEA